MHSKYLNYSSKIAAAVLGFSDLSFAATSNPQDPKTDWYANSGSATILRVPEGSQDQDPANSNLPAESAALSTASFSSLDSSEPDRVLTDEEQQSVKEVLERVQLRIHADAKSFLENCADPSNVSIQKMIAPALNSPRISESDVWKISGTTSFQQYGCGDWLRWHLVATRGSDWVKASEQDRSAAIKAILANDPDGVIGKAAELWVARYNITYAMKGERIYKERFMFSSDREGYTKFSPAQVEYHTGYISSFSMWSRDAQHSIGSAGRSAGRFVSDLPNDIWNGFKKNIVAIGVVGAGIVGLAFMAMRSLISAPSGLANPFPSEDPVKREQRLRNDAMRKRLLGLETERERYENERKYPDYWTWPTK